jgi:CubicO group peptidase (beta-lactamase class C family)
MKKYIAAQSIFSFVGIILLFAMSSVAQENIAAKVDEHVKSVMQKQNIPGISLAVVNNGQIVLAKGYGYANLEHQVPVKPETVFHTASVGKQFTATAVMMLVEEGKINVDEKISTYLGEVPESWKNITVRHLLTHTSGMTAYPKDFNYRRDYTEDELLKIAMDAPTAFQPGEKWEYSNLGYVTLGALIRKVTGKFYGDFLQERIFKPLGMPTVRIFSGSDIIPNRAAGYIPVNDEIKNQGWISPTINATADGGLYVSVLDMAKWDAALYGEKLLKKASLDQMWTRVTLNNSKRFEYGFGWEVTSINGHRLIAHNGAWQGFNAYIGRFVDDKLTVIVLVNRARFRIPKLGEEIAAIYNPELAPPVLKPIKDKEPQITARAKGFLQKLIEGKAEQEQFTSQAKEKLFPNGVKQAGDFLKTLGTLEKMQLVERKVENNIGTHRYRLNYKDASLIYTLNLTSDGKIAAIEFRRE